MHRLSRHLTRTPIAVALVPAALVPVGRFAPGTALAEDSSSESWLADMHFYFHGTGLVAVGKPGGGELEVLSGAWGGATRSARGRQ